MLQTHMSKLSSWYKSGKLQIKKTSKFWKHSIYLGLSVFSQKEEKGRNIELYIGKHVCQLAYSTGKRQAICWNSLYIEAFLILRIIFKNKKQVQGNKRNLCFGAVLKEKYCKVLSVVGWPG